MYTLIFKKIIRHKFIILLSIFYFILRLINLTKLPIFNDEAIYLDWGWREIHNGNLYYSLYDGKQPLLMWVFSFSQSIFTDPLFAGRIVSICTGFLSMIGIYFTGKLFFDKKTTYTATLFYTIVPIYSFFDRQALMESSISAIGIWIFLLYYKFYLNPRKLTAIFLGLIFGVGIFIKSSTLIFLITFVIFIVFAIIKEKNISQKWLLTQLSLLTVIISQIILIPLYLQSQFWLTLPMSYRYSLSITELFGFSIMTWLHNLFGIIDIAFWQTSPLFFTLSLIGLIYIVKTKNRIIAYWFLTIMILVILTVRNPSNRYTVSYLPLLTLFSAFFLNKIRLTRQKTIYFVILILIFITTLIPTLIEIANPIAYFSLLSKVSKFSDKTGYITDWPAGYGVPNAIDFISKSVGNGKFAVAGVEIDAGNPQNAVFTYFAKDNFIRPIYFDSRSFGNQLQGVKCLKTDVPLFFVSRGNKLAGLDLYLKEVSRFYKPENKDYVAIYILKSKCQGKTLTLRFTENK